MKCSVKKTGSWGFICILKNAPRSDTFFGGRRFELMKPQGFGDCLKTPFCLIGFFA